VPPSLKGRVLRALLAERGATVVHMVGDQARRDLHLVRETRARVPLLVEDAAALVLIACARAAAGLDGAMAEAGVYAGGTARLICEVKGAAPLHLFDVFETLQAGQAPPAAAEAATAVRARFGTLHARRADVEEALRPFPGVHVHAGVFPDTARATERETFAFAHLDLDLEVGTHAALEFFHPRLVRGGTILGDDYHDPGVRRAFDRYFRSSPDRVIELPWGQALVVRT
jgi:hypothetical protein